MDPSQTNWIANFIWGIADDVLRDLYVRGKYRDVILPMMVLRRLDAVPGITGLWQVEARQDPSFENYVSLDSKYIDDWSLRLDLRILLQTVNAVIRGTGS